MKYGALYSILLTCVVGGLLYLATFGGKNPLPSPLTPSVPTTEKKSPVRKPLFPFKRD